MADSAWIHSDICFRNKVGIFSFLLRDIAGFAEKRSGNALIKSPALGAAFRSEKGVGMSGSMRSCPWNWHRQNSPQSGERRVPGGNVNL